MKLERNKWKVSFIILIAINVLVILSLLVLILLPNDKTIEEEQNQTNSTVPFEVSTNKSDLTKLINFYLEKEGLNGPIHYEINLSNEVELFGYLPVFGNDVEMKLTFEAEPLKNGDIMLKQNSISVGQLPLPVSYVMKFIKNQYQLPSWVEIDPSEETIYMHVTEMRIANGLGIKVDTFDLENDDIKFNVLLPTE